MAVETVLPGLIAGTIGVFALGAGVVMAYADFGFRTGNTVLLVVMTLLVAGTVAWIKFFPDSPMAQVFVSKGQIGNLGVEKPELVGKAGVALTALRPAGTAVFDGKRVDVVSEGTFVPKGEMVKVIAVEGLRVVVRPART
jgi:membrane-bound serine protease (ClpP class)